MRLFKEACAVCRATAREEDVVSRDCGVCPAGRRVGLLWVVLRVCVCISMYLFELVVERNKAKIQALVRRGVRAPENIGVSFVSRVRRLSPEGCLGVCRRRAAPTFGIRAARFGAVACGESVASAAAADAASAGGRGGGCVR